jgi:hypothetical protein
MINRDNLVAKDYSLRDLNRSTKDDPITLEDTSNLTLSDFKIFEQDAKVSLFSAKSRMVTVLLCCNAFAMASPPTSVILLLDISTLFVNQ